MSFDTEGVYRIYYRGRGFDGSSDSFYTPDEFGSDPSDTEGLSSNGDFRWGKNTTEFLVDASLIDVPLELRLGMREQRAELDAFVLSTDFNLTDLELDALFDVLDGDYNGDGLVDAADYSVWRDSFGQTGPDLATDGDRSGEIDQGDYSVWSQNFGSAASGASSAPSSSVPEPTSAWPVATACLVLCLRSRPSVAPSRGTNQAVSLNRNPLG